MPPAYTTAQKGAISTISNMTGMDKSSATKLLRQHNWNENAAANSFFGGGAITASSPHKAAAAKLFDKYREDPKVSPDEIGTDGTMQMLQDMEINLEGLGPLIFSELVGAPAFGRLEKEPFVDGLTAAKYVEYSLLDCWFNEKDWRILTNSTV